MADSTDAFVNTNGKSNSNSLHLQSMADEELHKVFNKFDANGDGKISSSELSQVLSAMGSVSSAEDIKSAMEEIDTDRDGFISLAEFADFCRSNSADDSDLRDAFDLYDQDKNGLISSSELHQALKRLNMGSSMEECERMIKSVDSDGDGCVNYEEFKKMMTGGISATNEGSTATP